MYILIALLLVILFPPIVTTIIMLWWWHRVGQDPPGPKIRVTEFGPIPDANPIICDLILHNTTSTSAIMATVLQLCLSGYLLMYHQDKPFDPYIVELVKDPADLDPEQQQTIRIFFPNPQLHQRASLLCQSQIDSKYRVNIVDNIVDGAYRRVAYLSYFTTNPQSARAIGNIGATYLALLFLIPPMIAIGGNILTPMLQSLGLWPPTSLILILSGLPPYTGTFVIMFLLGLALAALINVGIAKWLPCRTPAGNDAKGKLEGFGRFVKMTIWPRVQQLQQPTNITTVPIPGTDLSQLKFEEEYLPYTLIFGLDQEWTLYRERLRFYPEQQISDAAELRSRYKWLIRQ